MRANTAQFVNSDFEPLGSPERGIRFLLACFLALIVMTDILDVSMSMGPGLSAKNAMLYVIASALIMRMIVQQSFTFELRALHVTFVVLIAYSILSMLVGYFVIEYPRYELIESTIALKSRLVDHAIFFLVFFYGVRESRNAHSMLKLLLFAVLLANTAAVLNSFGIIEVGDMEHRRDGRMTGVMGESNQDAAFVDLFLPAFAAGMLAYTGVWRLASLIGVLISLAALVMTASRGGYVGLIAASIWGMYAFRKYFPLRKILAIAIGALAIIVIVVALMSIEYGDLLYKRVIGDSSSADIVTSSSGRAEIWSTAIAAMAEAPLSFVTGFGWYTYWSMPFRLSPHNHYLSLWFNVGLVGLICGTALLVLVVREAMAALSAARVQYQPALIAFSIGAVAISVATFFVDLYTPWLWFWAYAGLVMRIAVNARSAPVWSQAEAPQPQQPSPSLVQRDPFGWVGTQRT
jgi:O-antigen ligase